ncbi:MAG: N-acetyl-gamma-glutamyl-phosphate reductase [Oscillospiraceae bacterium]|nr:N-acetyl-gamma-glutamyl-phosphate reductase [Oscillospiraceae bacterium]
MKPKIYIDGQAGTTGLQIMDRLKSRTDIELMLIADDKRHDDVERKRLMDQADLIFLCLPDKAAVEAVALAEGSKCRIIDASTAHRTNPNWVYGYSELNPTQKEAIQNAKYVANPGCHATGLISSTAPLVQAGLLPTNYPLTCYSLTGYSGGGKKMIADYESEGRDGKLDAPRIYGLTLNHKHIPEMTKVCGLEHAPVFCPVVDDYYKGMATSILLQNRLLNGTPTTADIHKALVKHYEGSALVSVAELGYNEPMIAANTLSGKDTLTLIVCGNDEQTTVTALFDNLGKGASGAAVQNMNLMLGFEETAGLSL